MTQELLNLWEQVDELANPYLSPITTKEQYQKALSFLECLWERVADNPDSPYGSLMHILATNIHEYEHEQNPLPDASPEQVLAFLIEARTGMCQSNVSEILKGKRKLTTEQIKQLSAFFKVNPAIFILKS